MRMRWGAVGIVLLLLAGGLCAKDDKSKDEDKLQGEWTVISMDMHGKSIPADKIQKLTTLLVKGNLWLKPVDDKKRVQFRFKLHADKNPKQIDINGAGQLGRGSTTSRGTF